jgi:two-component system LytT family response regulator
MNKSLRVVIVDDESLARRGLKLRLQAFDDLEIVGESSSGKEALVACAELSPDILFLDIQMPGMDGFEVIRHLQSDTMPMVVFVTAYDEYAIDAFKVHAIDYILKPADEDSLQQAVERARAHKEQQESLGDKARLLSMMGDLTQQAPEHLQQLLDEGKPLSPQYPEKISIKDGQNITRVKSTDIGWVDAAGDYMCIHEGSLIHVMRITMKELENQLDPAVFQRIHRSTIVNLERVEKVSAHINGEYQLTLDSGDRLKMSRSYKDKVKHFL